MARRNKPKLRRPGRAIEELGLVAYQWLGDRDEVEVAGPDVTRRPAGRTSSTRRAAVPVHDDDDVLVVVWSRSGAVVRRSKLGGRPLDARELQLQLTGASAAVAEAARRPPASSPPQLSAAEASLLDAAGLLDSPGGGASPLERSRLERELLLENSLTIDAAAAALGVSTSRIRQRLATKHPTLYGIRDGRRWRIPRFQFETKGKLVRGLEEVVPHIRRDAHPVAVRDWFTTPHVDLVIGAGDDRVSPKSWLAAGHPIGVVAELADEI